jgi:hypothetical protein
MMQRERDNAAEKDETILPAEGIESPDGEQPYRYNRELFYSFDREKGFSAKVDYQYDANQVIIRQSWDAAGERLEQVRQAVIAGKRSPIAYFMEKQLMEVPMLAAYVGLKKWKVRWHLTNTGFRRMKPDTLQKYAGVFDIPVTELTNPPFLT